MRHTTSDGREYVISADSKCNHRVYAVDGEDSTYAGTIVPARWENGEHVNGDGVPAWTVRDGDGVPMSHADAATVVLDAAVATVRLAAYIRYVGDSPYGDVIARYFRGGAHTLAEVSDGALDECAQIARSAATVPAWSDIRAHLETFAATCDAETLERLREQLEEDGETLEEDGEHVSRSNVPVEEIRDGDTFTGPDGSGWRATGPATSTDDGVIVPVEYIPDGGRGERVFPAGHRVELQREYPLEDGPGGAWSASTPREVMADAVLELRRYAEMLEDLERTAYASNVRGVAEDLERTASNLETGE